MTFWDKPSTKFLVYAEVFVILSILMYSGFHVFSDMVEDISEEGGNTSDGNTSELFDGPLGIFADIMPFFWLIMILFMVGHMWLRFGGYRY